MIEIEIDPNAIGRRHPGATPARYRGEHLSTGDTVLAVQPYDDEPDYVGTAVVRAVERDIGLIYLDVDWSSFRDRPQP